ncbi:hypothetical protein VNO78_19738 [Psophocarpus tetragonolobus]|uniref:Uncharacterized protein n=1 Tax=Psophocarpus tetragonolobus TaxID=3891 RepID=A0AAN9S833_PSOTE
MQDLFHVQSVQEQVCIDIVTSIERTQRQEYHLIKWIYHNTGKCNKNRWRRTREKETKWKRKEWGRGIGSSQHEMDMGPSHLKWARGKISCLIPCGQALGVTDHLKSTEPLWANPILPQPTSHCHVSNHLIAICPVVFQQQIQGLTDSALPSLRFYKL